MIQLRQRRLIENSSLLVSWPCLFITLLTYSSFYQYIPGYMLRLYALIYVLNKQICVLTTQDLNVFQFCIQNSLYHNSASHQRASNQKKFLQPNLISNPDYEE